MQADREQYLRSRLEEAIPGEWGRVVRLCASLTGHPDAAEDLAQETMIEAWRHIHSLRNPDAMAAWLSGIARNVCLRWSRGQGREAVRFDRFARSDDALPKTARIDGSDEFLSLERDELASLIDRALARIPASSRDVLVQHYVEELRHEEIAESLGLTENAVAVRIHRGKQALKRVLAQPELGAEAATYGLLSPSEVGWQETRVWCPFCGRHRVAVRIEQGTGVLSARCTGPCYRDGTIIGGKTITGASSALTSVKSILRRELLSLHAYYRPVLEDRHEHCLGCGCALPVEYQRAEDESAMPSPFAYGIMMFCPECNIENSAHLSHLLVDNPHVQQFWRGHARMELLPVKSIDWHGRPALLCGLASLDTSARIEMISAADTYEVLHIDGPVGR